LVEHRIVLINEYAATGLGSMNTQLMSVSNAQQKWGVALSDSQKQLVQQGQKIKEYQLLQSKGISLTTEQAASLKSLEKDFVSSGGSLDTLTRKHDDFLKSFTKFRWALVNAALAMVLVYGGFKLLIQPSIDFEKEMAGVRRTTGYSRDEIKMLGNELIKMSTYLPVSAQELAKIAGVAGQLGLGGLGAKSMQQFTTTISLFSTATGMSAEDAATNMAKVSQAFGLPITQVNNLASAVLRLADDTAATSEDIVKSLVRVAAAGNNMGLSVTFLSALEATLISAGISAERAGTRMQNALNRITGNIGAFASLTNMSIQEFTTLLNTDAEGAIMKIVESLRNYGDSTAIAAKTTQLFGEIGGTAILTLVNNYDQLITNVDSANKSFAAGLDLIKKSGEQAQTVSAQWQLLSNTLKQVALNNEGVVARIVEGFRETISQWDEFKKGFQTGGLINPLLGIVTGFQAVGDSAQEDVGNAIIELGALSQKAGQTQEQFTAMEKDILNQPMPMQMLDQAKKYADYLQGIIDKKGTEATVTQVASDRFVAYSDALSAYMAARDKLNNIEGVSIDQYMEMSSELEDVKSRIEQSFPGVLPSIEAYYNLLQKTTSATDSLGNSTDMYAEKLRQLQSELNGVNNNLSKTRSELSDMEKKVNIILNRRLNLGGISETDISHLIRQQELELAKAKFSTLGLGTAEEFLGKSSLITADSINTQTEAVRRLNDATKTGQDQYEAWKTALSETIRALLINSQSLDKDVTSVVTKAQTQLLGISQFGNGTNNQFQTMETNLDALNQAQEIFFGSEREKLDYSEKQREDRINGMNTSAEATMAELAVSRDAIDQLLAKEDEWLAKQEELKNKIAEVTEAQRKLREEMNAASTTPNTPTTPTTSNLSPEMQRIQSLSEANSDLTAGQIINMARGNTAGSSSGSVQYTPNPYYKPNPLAGTVFDPTHPFGPGFQDFISRPGVPATTFSPSDTIVGVKDTGSLGKGGSSIGSVYINISGYNKSPRELALEIQRNLASLA